MKRAAAIVLSLMIVWLQAMSSAQTSFRPAPRVCSCCNCKRTDCCVRTATPDRQPLPAIPATAGSQDNISLFAPALVAWPLPASLPPQITSSATAPLPALAVPLFTRHCAWLI